MWKCKKCGGNKFHVVTTISYDDKILGITGMPKKYNNRSSLYECSDCGAEGLNIKKIAVWNVKEAQNA